MRIGGMATKTASKSSSRKAAPNRKASKKKTSRCWPGYEPTPGKKPGATGSCKKK